MMTLKACAAPLRLVLGAVVFSALTACGGGEERIPTAFDAVPTERQQELIKSFNDEVAQEDAERVNLVMSLLQQDNEGSAAPEAVSAGPAPAPGGSLATGARPAPGTGQPNAVLAENPPVLGMTVPPGSGNSTYTTGRQRAAVHPDFQPVYRVRQSLAPGAYALTQSAAERAEWLQANPAWKAEGPAFYAGQAPMEGLSAVWRLRNQRSGAYVYTLFESERDAILAQHGERFVSEGVAWYARVTPAPGYTPLYRFRNLSTGVYLFTAYESERRYLQESLGGRYEFQGAAMHVQVPGGSRPPPPDLSMEVQREALKAAVRTDLQTVLSPQTDNPLRFVTSNTSHGLVVGSVFVHGDVAYKVTAIGVDAGGDIVIDTELAAIADVYDDMAFSLTLHGVPYDAQGRPLSEAQLATPQPSAPGAKSWTRVLANCMRPGQTLEGNYRADGDSLSFGIVIEIANCSLDQMLGLPEPSGALAGRVRVDGRVLATANYFKLHDEVENTSYSRLNWGVEGALNVSMSLPDYDGLDIPDSSPCKLEEGKIKCELFLLESLFPERQHWAYLVPFTVRYAPVVELEFDGQAQLGFSYRASGVRAEGRIAGVPISIQQTDFGRSESTGARVQMSTSVEIEAAALAKVQASVPQLLYLPTRIPTGVNVEVYGGAYGLVSGQLLPSCWSWEPGAKAGASLDAISIGDWSVLDVSLQGRWPFTQYMRTYPAGCNDPSQIWLQYTMPRSQHRDANPIESTDTTDRWRLRRTWLSTGPTDHRRLDFSLTRGLPQQPLEFALEVLPTTRVSGALPTVTQVQVVEPTSPTGDARIVHLDFNTGGATWGDEIHLRVRAWVPDRPQTEVSRTLVLVVDADPNPVMTNRLPHTGVTAEQCYQVGSDVLVSCSSAGAIALSGPSKQDGMRTHINPMSYTKIGFNGAVLPAGASSWCAVRDNVTGLMWENHQSSPSTYTNWADNRSGDASLYANQNATLCGLSGWRLPKVEELETIVDAGRSHPAINTTWFPHTPSNWYWSSSPHAQNSILAWFADFDEGQVGANYYHSSHHVRLVRAGP